MSAKLPPNFGELEITRRVRALMGVPADFKGGRLAIIAHGLQSDYSAPHIEKIYSAYLECGYRVIVPNLSFDPKRDFTIAAHVNDLRTTIDWALIEKQNLEFDGIALAGHSMGGLAACITAAEYNASHVLLVAPVTSGVRSLLARQNLDNHPDGLEGLEREIPGALEEWPQFSAYDYIDKLTMAISAIVGSEDTLTLPSDVEAFSLQLPNCVEMKIIKGAHHCMEFAQETFDYAKMVRKLEARMLHP